MTLDADQLSDLRADVGDDGTVFSDAELQRLYTREGEDYNRAVLLALRQIRSNAVKLHDYQIAHSMERRSQVFDHLTTVINDWQQNVVGAPQQVQFAAMRSTPPRNKAEPDA